MGRQQDRHEGDDGEEAARTGEGHVEGSPEKLEEFAGRDERCADAPACAIDTTHDADVRGIENGDWVGIESRTGQIVLRAVVTERITPGVVYTTFHFPETGANIVTTDNSDWATNCPEYKVTAVQVTPSNQPAEWQTEWEERERENKRVEDKPLIAAE